MNFMEQKSRNTCKLKQQLGSVITDDFIRQSSCTITSKYEQVKNVGQVSFIAIITITNILLYTKLPRRMISTSNGTPGESNFSNSNNFEYHIIHILYTYIVFYF